MYRIYAMLTGSGNDCVHVEIGSRALTRQGMRHIAEPCVQHVGIVFGIDHDAGPAQSGGRPRDTDGDLAAIGDQ